MRDTWNPVITTLISSKGGRFFFFDILFSLNQMGQFIFVFNSVCLFPVRLGYRSWRAGLEIQIVHLLHQGPGLGRVHVRDPSRSHQQHHSQCGRWAFHSLWYIPAWSSFKLWLMDQRESLSGCERNNLSETVHLNWLTLPQVI